MPVWRSAEADSSALSMKAAKGLVELDLKRKYETVLLGDQKELKLLIIRDLTKYSVMRDITKSPI